MQVSPDNGFALQTNFLIATTGWSDDPADLPLSYDFEYRWVFACISPLVFWCLSTLTIAAPFPLTCRLAVSTKVPPLIIRGVGPVPSVTAQLPAGLQARDGNVTIIARALDVYLSQANTSAEIAVVVNASVSPAGFLKGGITSALSSGNADAVLGLISAVSSSISSTNCSQAPNCTALNRGTCVETPNTCGACNAGFMGVFGNANAKCHRVVSKQGRKLIAVDLEGTTASPTRGPTKGPSKSAPTVRPTSGTANSTYVVGNVGDRCRQHGDCLYDVCVGGHCLAPNKTCTTNVPDRVCSGNGACKFFDNSGNPFPGSCSILNVFCNAKCICQAGYGGADCSLAPSALSSQSSTRVTMCAALLKTVATQDPSAQLFDTITSALLSSYEFSEITSTLGQVSLVCGLITRRRREALTYFNPHLTHRNTSPTTDCRSRAPSS